MVFFGILLSTRGPIERTSGQKVDVQVGNGFTSVAAAVDDEAEAFAFIADAEFLRDVAGGDQEMSQNGFILFPGPCHARDGFFRNDEDVDGCLGADVAEGNADLVLMDDIGGDFPPDDPFKEGHGFRGWAQAGGRQ